MLLVLVLALLARSGYAQSPNWQWAVQSTGTGTTQVKNIAVDAAGNSYVVGFFTERAQFGSSVLISQGRSDLFAAKLTAAGHWEWAVAAGGAGSDNATGVAVDPTGRIFVTGSFEEQVRFGPTTLTSQGDKDVFVAQLGPQGQWLWTTTAGGTGMDRASALTTTRNGELVVAGQFAETAAFGTRQLVSRGSSDAFIARLTPAGTWQWTTAVGGPDNDEATALASNDKGEIYVTGFFSEQVTFGTSVLTGSGMDDAFVGKLTGTGQWLWATAGTSTNTAYGKGIAADPAGGVFVTGSYWGRARFGATSLSSNASDDGFVARLTDDGQWQWVTTLSSDYLDNIVGIALDKLGKLYVAGTFSRTIQAGPFQLTSQGHQDVFVGYLNRTGTWLGLTAAGGTATDATQTMALAPGGQVYVGGQFSTAALFGTAQLQSATPNAQAYVGRAAVPQL
ncbi:hypothetical protein GCM10022408_14480 [Hymenobacter fastidiosus]|uniref:SBBP repeat-containing protein n=1 Tax=Hymenobacter fastidiosus TaxID=486264 RepID=A0ABP7RYC5_9BACT